MIALVSMSRAKLACDKHWLSMVKMLHVSDQSWNNSWGSAAQFLLAKIGYASSGITSYDKEPSNKTTQNQPKTPKNPFKPADLMQILQFTSAQMVQFWWSKYVSLTQNWLELANLFMGILWCLISQYFLIGYHCNFLHYNEQGQGSMSFSRPFRGQLKHYSDYITPVVREAPLNIPIYPNFHES